MSPFRRGKVWWASIPQKGGGRVRQSLETENRHEAMTRESELRNSAERERLGLEQRDRNPRRLTLSKAVDLHFATRGKAQAQREKLGVMLTRHIQEDALGALLLEAVTPAAIVAWLEEREEMGLGPATRNRLRSAVSAIFRGLIERGAWLGPNPVARVHRQKEPTPRGKTIPPEHIPLLIDAAPSERWARAFALAAYAGLRRSEIERLTWGDIDTAARIIRVEETKTGVPRTVGLHRELADLLGKPGRGAVVGHVGWNKSAEVVRRALARAEIADESATFHALRRTWASRLVDCGADPFLVRLMGWGPPPGDVMATHYVRPRAAFVAAIDLLRWTADVFEIESQSRHVRGGRRERR